MTEQDSEEAAARSLTSGLAVWWSSAQTSRLSCRLSCVALLQAERVAADAAKQREAEQEAEEEAARTLRAAKKQQSPAGARAALSVVQLWRRQPCHWPLVVGAACLKDTGLSQPEASCIQTHASAECTLRLMLYASWPHSAAQSLFWLKICLTLLMTFLGASELQFGAW